MTQSPLFYESFNDALRDAIRACGGTKVVAAKLWAEKSPDSAAHLPSLAGGRLYPHWCQPR